MGTPQKKVEVMKDPDRDTLEKMRNWIIGYHDTTAEYRLNAKKCGDFVDGKQWRQEDLDYRKDRKLPALTVNHLSSQVDLVSGMQRSNRINITPIPREPMDVKVSELSRASLLAARDFGKYPLVWSRVFDDATIGGLGFMEVIYTLEDAEDAFWGDIVYSRINPLSVVWDPWNMSPDRFQKSRFIGKMDWVSKDEWTVLLPNLDFSLEAVWDNALASDLDVPDSLRGELFDERMGKTRLITMWHKEPKSVMVMANEETGEAHVVKSKSKIGQMKKELSQKEGKEIADQLVVYETDTEVLLGDDLGNVMVNAQTGEPLRFTDRKAADQALDNLVKEVGLELSEQLNVVERKFMVPHWTRMTWGRVIDSGVTPYETRKYPIVPYVSRQYTDAPESIRGIILDAIQPQEEYNKRASQELSHLNSQTHTGWLNKRQGGANPKLLAMVGSQPGSVIEYTSVKPDRIEPSQISSGHFTLKQEALANLRRVTGITDERSGITTQKTVSGSAIRERKEGANLTLAPRFDNAAWTELEVADITLSIIKELWPVEKIMRVVGVAETQEPLGRNGQSVFEGLTPSQIQSLLKDVKTTLFDLTFDAERPTASEQQAQFEKAIEAVSLAANAGYQIGQKTLMEIGKLSSMPSSMKEAFVQDLSQPPVSQDPQQVAAALEETKNQFRGGRAGGNDGTEQ